MEEKTKVKWAGFIEFLIGLGIYMIGVWGTLVGIYYLIGLFYEG